MAENLGAVAEANVVLKIDDSSINKQISDTNKKLEATLAKTNAKAAATLTKQLDRDISRLGKQLERTGEKTSKFLEKGLKVGVGVGTSALYAFLKNGTPAAERFGVSLENLKTAWGRVGQTLATKIKFGGATGQELLDKLVTKIENLDTTQIEKIVGYFKAAAAAWATIKLAQGANVLFQFGSNISKIAESLKGLNNVNRKQPLENLPLTSQNLGNTALNAAVTASIVKGIPIKVRAKLDEIKSRMKTSNALGLTPEQLVSSIPANWRSERSKFDLDGFNAAQKKRDEEALKNKRTPFYNYEALKSMREGSINRGLGAVMIGTSVAANAASVISGSKSDLGINTTQAIGKTGAVVLGTLIAGPIGGAIAAAAAEAADVISKGIAKAFEKSVDYYHKKLEANRGLLWNSNKSILPSDDVAQANRKMREKLFDSQINTAVFALRKSSVYSDYLKDQNAQYPSGSMPAFKLKTTNIVTNTADKINTLTMIEKQMLDIYETFTDEEKVRNTEFKDKLDAISEQKNFYIGEQNKQISIWKDAKEKERKFNEQLKEFDRSAVDARTAYENTLNDINKNKDWNKPFQSSISMGGDIASIPAIISASLNESKNKQSEKINEDFQKIIDTQLAALQYQMDMFNLTAEEKKFREETTKQDREDRKTIKENVTEIKTYIKGGPTTVTAIN